MNGNKLFVDTNIVLYLLSGDKTLSELPDSIIMSSAIYLDLPLITADADFKKVEELNLLYYER